MDENEAVMESILYNHLNRASNNQYIVIHVKEGDIYVVEPCSRLLGVLTLGLSWFFTSPYVIVEGQRTEKNESYIQDLTKRLSCKIVDALQ
jgi:hypothetical protein